MAKTEITDLVRVKPTHINPNVHFTLPVPPSSNSLHYNVRGGGRRLTPLAQDYIKRSRASIRQQAVDTHWLCVQKNEWMYLDLVFYFPDRRIRDSHNCLKILMDVLQGIVYENDYSVMPRIQAVKYDKDNPRVEMVFSYQTQDEHERSIAEYV